MFPGFFHYLGYRMGPLGIKSGTGNHLRAHQVSMPLLLCSVLIHSIVMFLYSYLMKCMLMSEMSPCSSQFHMRGSK